MDGHETELVAGMAPADAATWRSELGEEGFKVRFQHEGVYIYKCHSHLSAGMFGAIVVGDGEPANLAAIEASLAGIEAGRLAIERVVAKLKDELTRKL
jgi:hypothetical protein